MRTRREIEDLQNEIYEDYETDAGPWNEAVIATLDWILGNTDDKPRRDR